MTGAGFVLVLEGMEKPGNLGAVLRTADAAGVDAVIAADPATDLYNPNVVRASAGLVVHRPLGGGVRGQATRQWLRDRGLTIHIARPQVGAPSPWDVDLDLPTGIVVGGERAGVSAVWDGDRAVSIPMRGVRRQPQRSHRGGDHRLRVGPAAGRRGRPRLDRSPVHPARRGTLRRPSDRLGPTAARRPGPDRRRQADRGVLLMSDSGSESNEHRVGFLRRAARGASERVIDVIDPDTILSHVDINALLERIDINELLARADVDALVDRIDLNGLLDRIDVKALLERIDLNAVLDQVDVDALIDRIDVNRLVDQVDVAQLLAKIDVADVVDRIDVDGLVQRVDIPRVVDRIDVDEVLAKVDIDAVIDRIDVPAVVQRAGIPEIVAESTSHLTSSALDLFRRPVVGIDEIVFRGVNRLVRRDPTEFPPGPGPLVHWADEHGENDEGLRTGRYAGPVTRLLAVVIDVLLLTAGFTLGVAGVGFMLALITGGRVELAESGWVYGALSRRDGALLHVAVHRRVREDGGQGGHGQQGGQRRRFAGPAQPAAGGARPRLSGECPAVRHRAARHPVRTRAAGMARPQRRHRRGLRLGYPGRPHAVTARRLARASRKMSALSFRGRRLSGRGQVQAFPSTTSIPSSRSHHRHTTRSTEDDRISSSSTSRSPPRE